MWILPHFGNTKATIIFRHLSKHPLHPSGRNTHPQHQEDTDSRSASHCMPVALTLPVHAAREQDKCQRHPEYTDSVGRTCNPTAHEKRLSEIKTCMNLRHRRDPITKRGPIFHCQDPVNQSLANKSKLRRNHPTCSIGE